MIRFIIFGIDFGISVGFAGVLCLMLYIDRAGLMVPTVMAVTLHESGHLMALILLKSKPKRIELKIGAVGISGNFILNPKSEVFMLAAGSSLNIICFILLYSLYYFCKIQYMLDLSFVMLVIGAFNLLPIIGLDGGDILKIILSKFLKIKIANLLLFIISIITAMLIIFFGFFVLVDTKSNISLILLGLYLFLGILLSKKQKNDCKIYQNIVK